MTASLIMLALYALCIVGIVLYMQKKKKTSGDYLLGDRKVGAWMSAFAYGTSYFSAVIFVGYAGSSGWNLGLSAVLIGLGNALIGSYLAWRVMARRTRHMTHHLGVSTMPTFFEKRYQSRFMKLFSAAAIFIFLVPYSASVYKGIGYMFNAIFGIEFIYCMIFIAVLTAIYVLVGGYLTTAAVNFVQGIIMLAGVALMIVYIVNAPQVGGLANGFEQLGDIRPDLIGIFPSDANAVNLIALIILTSLGCWGLPQMLHKFYAVKDNKAIVRGTVISTVFALVIGGGAYFTGVFGRLFADNPSAVLNGAQFDLVVPEMLFAALPDLMLGLVLILLLSASMSTLSSLVLVSASSITVDLMQDNVLKNAPAKKVTNYSRLFSLLFIILSLVVALPKQGAIVTLMSFSWGSLSGAFLGPFLWGLFDRRTNRTGAFTGMFAGLISAIVISLLTNSTPIGGSCAMFVSLIVTPLVSRFTRPMDAEVVKNLFDFKA